MDATGLLTGTNIIPVVVIDDPDDALMLADTLIGAGLDTIEITLRTAAALKAIDNICKKFPDACIGAGSVRNATQIAQVKDVGAKFAVSPGSSAELLDAAEHHRFPFVPGAVTASEIIHLQGHGYSLIKFFPAELAGGIRMLQALGAPLPEARFFPTGGISQEMAPEYLRLSNVSCIGGSWIAPTSLINSRDFETISRLARDAGRIGT